MNEEQKDIDTIGDLMANVEIEGSLADDQNIDEQGKETSEASPAENKPNVESPSQEGEPATETKVEEANIPDETNNLPFNKHPRFQELVEEKNYFKEKFEEAMGLVQQSKGTAPIVDKPTEGVKIPKFFADVYGEDPEAYAEFLNVQRQEAERVFMEKQQKEQQEREEQRKIKQQEEEYISQQFKEIQDKHGVRLDPGTNERNEFTKFYLENPIGGFNPDGTRKYDIVAGYELFNRIKTAEQSAPSAVVQQKKAIASQTIDRTATAAAPTGLTREQKAKMSFSEIAAYALKEKGLM